jgi:hypothetical protein
VDAAVGDQERRWPQSELRRRGETSFSSGLKGGDTSVSLVRPKSGMLENLCNGYYIGIVPFE